MILCRLARQLRIWTSVREWTLTEEKKEVCSASSDDAKMWNGSYGAGKHTPPTVHGAMNHGKGAVACAAAALRDQAVTKPPFAGGVSGLCSLGSCRLLAFSREGRMAHHSWNAERLRSRVGVCISHRWLRQDASQTLRRAPVCVKFLPPNPQFLWESSVFVTKADM